MSLVLTYLKDGQAFETREPEEIDRWIGQTGVPFWLDLLSPAEEELLWLEQTFGFHPLTLEDLREENPRPKLEDYPGYIFLVAHGALVKPNELATAEIHIFVSERYIITSHAEVLERQENFQHPYAEKAAWLQRGSDFCLYRLLDNLADGYLTVVNDIDDELDALQNEILVGGGLRSIEPIVTIRRQLAGLRRIVSPTREIASELSLHQYQFLRAETLIYFRDVHNLLVTIFDLTETERDVVSNILDAHLSAVSNRLNDIMKRLTVVATIFMPITFITGFAGMNFSSLPFDSPQFLAITLASLLIIPLLMLIWFRREGWF